MVIRRIRKRIKALKRLVLGGLLASLLVSLNGCLIRPDPVDGNNAASNPTMLVFKTATPLPTALPQGGGATGEGGEAPVAISTDVPSASWTPGQTVVTATPAVFAVATFSIGGDTTVVGVPGLATAGDGLATAVASASPEAALRRGASGTRVTALQQQLKNLGYYSGSVDGDYGDGTVSAVKAFQSRNGLTADGIAGAATLNLLASGSAKKAATPKPTSKPTAKPTATSSALRVGSSGSAVKNLQQKLKNLGYYTGSVDGAFGAGTESALKAFQRANGLSADGVAGSATLSRLNSSKAKSASSSSSRATARPAMRTYVPSTLSSYRYLQVGSSGSDVRKMQQRLADLGYYSGTVTGSFGDSTYAAVRAFQQRNGLWVDGVAGEDTQRMLYSAEALGAKK